MKTKTQFLFLCYFLNIRFLIVMFSILLFPPMVYADGSTLGSNGDGIGLSLAFDSSDTAYFAYFNASDNSLRIAHDSGSGWVVEKLESNLIAPSDTALTFKNDLPHIFYINSNSQLTHVYKAGSSWRKEVVSPTDYVAGTLSAVSFGSEICVTFYNRTEQTLKLACSSGSSWAISYVDHSNTNIGIMNSITTTPSGTLAIAYLDLTNFRLKVATELVENNWQIESINYLDHKFGLYPAIAVDQAGTIHVSSSRYKSTYTLPDLSVYYSRKLKNGKWQTVEVSRDYAGGPTAIAINANMAPLIAFRHLQYNESQGDNVNVRLLSLNSSGIWSEKLYNGDIDGVLLPYTIDKISLAIDTSGDPAIAFNFSRGSFQNSPAVTAIRYYKDSQTDGSDDEETIDSGGSTSSQNSSTSSSSTSSASSTASYTGSSSSANPQQPSSGDYQTANIPTWLAYCIQLRSASSQQRLQILADIREEEDEDLLILIYKYCRNAFVGR